jgi:SAM-dependent methyltransferase
MPALPEARAARPAADLPKCLPPIVSCARGDLPANVALMRAAIEAREPADVGCALQAAYGYLVRQGAVAEAARIGRAIELGEGSPDAFALVKDIVRLADHGGRGLTSAEHVGRWAKAFDAAAEISPEASVALYSLGDPRILDAITEEVVARMREWGLLSADRSVLEIGCGIGRFARALAPAVGSIVGIDVSDRMVEIARARCADLPNATFLGGSGHDLASFADASFDLVCAIDVLPYLAEAEGSLAAACLREASRVLRPDGRILVLNWSYRGDAAADRVEVERIAGDLGLVAIRSGTADFGLWDGITFLLAHRNAARG